MKLNIPQPSDMAKEMVQEAGYPVHMGSNYCKEHKAASPTNNCAGCESNEGCGKMAEIMLLVMQASMYKPRSFEDSIRTGEVLSRKIKEILKSGE